MRTPAFPAMHYDLADNEHGLTMRDYFAAKAMPIVMTPLLVEMQKRSISDADASKLKKVAADACYGIAEAMMKAREE